ncbi:hypothetical protein R6Q59_004525 [Mikania micrantha]
MNSYGYSYVGCMRIIDNFVDQMLNSGIDFNTSISFEDLEQLQFSCETEGKAETSDAVGKPMVWIGIYIAIASLFCILAMAADLWHGLRHKKLWFPCKYFTLNAASITVIAVTMKLPVDLTSGGSGPDQATKLGSLGFLCTMMANLMPSLASMDNRTLLANVAGLCVLVITIIANICIQIYTGAIENLSGLDIFCACFTNIPRVITMKCQESVIEKREASVKVAARLLGKTRKIIERLEARDIPSMDDEKKAYIDEWRLYLKQSIP